MTISVSDIDFKKSEVVNSTTTNGGRKGQVSITSGARCNIFPRVTLSDRTSGVTRYRKIFWCNENADDDSANDVLNNLLYPSNGGDRYYFGVGSQIDTQSIIGGTTEPDWMGCGQLQTALSGAETSIKLTMSSDDYVFEPGGQLYICDKFETGQTIDTGVVVGNSVTYTTGTWYAATMSDDITYPNGIYIGSNTVLTDNSANEEYLTIAETSYTDEDIGNGDTTTSPALTTLANVTNGVCTQIGYLPTVTATSGASPLTVNVAKDGSCSGDCSAGTLNMTSGVWTVDIVWSGATDSGTDVLCTYWQNNFSYSGNVVTIATSDAVANAYATANTYGSGCLQSGEITPNLEDFVNNSSAGTCTETSWTYYNDGTEYDTWTFTFTSATAYTCAGTREGTLSTSGSISADYEPTNPNTSQPYFTIPSACWGGTFVATDTITFTTNPSAAPIWYKEVVPSSTSAEQNNYSIQNWYAE